MRAAFIVVLFACSCALADVSLKSGGVTIGPVTALDCAADAGFSCTRATGTSTGTLRCVTASALLPGCVSTGDQVFNGTKTVDGGFAVNGPTRLDGGLVVIGPSTFDAGVYVQGILTVDGGIQSRRNIVGQHIYSTNGDFVGTTPTDGGLASYLSLTDLVTGRPTAYLPASQGLQLADGFSVPHSAQMCGFYPGTPIANPVTVVSQRFSGDGQFTRLSATVIRAGQGDGGLQVDGGPSQGWYMEVFDTTGGGRLCNSNHTQCGVSVGVSSSACALDGGALYVSADDVEIRFNMLECFIPPLVNACAQYNGPP